MAGGAYDALGGEVQRLLIQLDVPADVRHAIMAIIRDDAKPGDPAERRSDAPFQLRVARTFYKTSLRATNALGTSSLSMVIMLFDLYLAHEQGQSISVSSLCIASGAAPTTALRQIGLLEDRGYATRRSDEHDRRRWWVSPTARAIELVRSIIDEWTTALHS